MLLKASVWNGGMFDDEENQRRQKRFSSLIRNVKNAEIIEDHLEYVKFKAPNEKKIKDIIKDKFENNGWVIKQNK